MNEHPGDEAEQLYGTGEGARLYEAVWTAARGDGRTALAILAGLYVETSARLVQQEIVSSQQERTFKAFCQVGGHRLIDIASSSMGTSPQNMGATVAKHIRNRFERVLLTRTKSDDSDEDIE